MIEDYLIRKQAGAGRETLILTGFGGEWKAQRGRNYFIRRYRMPMIDDKEIEACQAAISDIFATRGEEVSGAWSGRAWKS